MKNLSLRKKCSRKKELYCPICLSRVEEYDPEHDAGIYVCSCLHDFYESDLLWFEEVSDKLDEASKWIEEVEAVTDESLYHVW